MGYRSGGLRSRKKWSFVLVACVAALAVGVSAFAFLRVNTGAQAVERPVPSYTRPAVPELKRVPVADAMQRLNDPGRPFTIVILGDSTGADADSWPVLVSEWVSERYDRPAQIHPWRQAEGGGNYGKPIDVGDGSNAPIHVFNASAPSKNAEYSFTHLDIMIPNGLSPDLVLVNHGHNHGPDTLVTDIHRLAMALTAKYEDTSHMLILQNPEKPGTPHDRIQQLSTQSLSAYARRASLETIDVERAYLELGDFSSLYKDNVHPDGEAGYRIWADTVIDALKSE